MKNKPDAPLRNVKASHNRDAKLIAMIERLMVRIERIEKLLAIKPLKRGVSKLALAVVLALPLFAHAEGYTPYPRLPVNLVTVPVNGAPSAREAKAIFRAAHKKYAEIGINLSLVKVRERLNSRDRGYQPGDDEDWIGRYKSIRKGWRDYFRTRAVKRAVNVALIPRMQFSDGPKMGGMASGICEFRTAVAWAAISIEDERTRQAAPIVLAHEIGHVAGAWHTDDWTISIMHPSPIMWLDLGVTLDFDLDSATSIRACLRGLGYGPNY